jgi:hypothetical protein
VQDFPTLQLPDVYQVIGYYLKHSAELAGYFEKREREEKNSWPLTRSGPLAGCVSVYCPAGKLGEWLADENFDNDIILRRAPEFDMMRRDSGYARAIAVRFAVHADISCAGTRYRSAR